MIHSILHSHISMLKESDFKVLMQLILVLLLMIGNRNYNSCINRLVDDSNEEVFYI